MRTPLETAQKWEQILRASFSANREVTLKTAARNAHDIVPAESAAIFVVREEAPTQLELVASYTDKDQDKHDRVRVEIAARPGSGITGYAAHEGVLVNLWGSALRENEFYSGQPSPHLFGERDSSLLVVPIKDRKSRLLGLLKFQNRKRADGSIDPDGRFDADDEAWALMLASKLAFALENLRVLETFRRLMDDVRSIRTHSKVCDKILDCAMNVVAANRGDLALWDPKVNDLILVSQWGPRAHTRNAGEPAPNQGIIRRVWQDRNAHYRLVSDVTGLSDYHMAHPSTQSELALRLEVNGRPIGVLNAEAFHKDWFDKNDLSSLEILGQQAAVALQVVDAARQVDELARQIYQDLDKPLRSSLNNVLYTMRDIFHLEHAIAYIVDEQRKVLDCVAWMGVSVDHTGFSWRLDEPALATHVLKTMQGHFSADPAHDPLMNKAGIARFGITSPTVAVPLVFRGRALGVLVAWSPVHKPTEDHIQLLDPLAQMAAWKIEVWRAFEEQREARVSYQTLVNALPHAVLQKDKHGRFTFANRLFCESLGKSMSAIIGCQDADFYPAAMARKFREDDERVMKTRQPLTQEELNQPAGKEARWVKVIKVPLFDAQGEPCGVQAIFWDITSEKKQTAELQSMIAELSGALEYKDRLLQEIEIQGKSQGSGEDRGGSSGSGGGASSGRRGGAGKEETAVFVSYAHEDRRYCDEIARHLVLLRGVACFSDQDVLPGSAWHDTILSAAHQSKIAVVLISADFLASAYIRDHEAPILFAAGAKTVIPVFVRKSSVETIPYPFNGPRGAEEIFLTRYQGINSPDDPLQGLSRNKRDALYVRLANRICVLTGSPPPVPGA